MKNLFFDHQKGAVCRVGGNGASHPSQVRGLKLVKSGESLLDVGCGSATTAECLRDYYPEKDVKYKGIDFIDHRIEWNRKYFPKFKFEVQDSEKLNEKDNSWDVVWSRHVLDHTSSFDGGMDEYLRVAKKKVICILFNSWGAAGKHEIRHIKGRDEAGNEVVYDDYYNSYDKKLAIEYLESKKGWGYRIFETVGTHGIVIPGIQKFAARDIIIYLYNENWNSGQLKPKI